MSKEQIKIEINNVLDHLSDDALNELLIILRELDRKKSSSFYNEKTLNQVMEEDNVLLKKLAQ